MLRYWVTYFAKGGTRSVAHQWNPAQLLFLLATSLNSYLFQAFEAVEKAAALERMSTNGRDVVFLVFSALCADIFNHGTLLEIGSISAQDFREVDIEHDSLMLKQSARLVTDAILSNGTKGLDLPTAVRSWRSLRHLAEIVNAMVAKSG